MMLMQLICIKCRVESTSITLALNMRFRRERVLLSWQFVFPKIHDKEPLSLCKLWLLSLTLTFFIHGSFAVVGNFAVFCSLDYHLDVPMQCNGRQNVV